MSVLQQTLSSSNDKANGHGAIATHPEIASLHIVENIYKSFGDAPILEDISISLVPGGVTCLLGPSGCGKSTLLRIAAGLVPPDSGSLLANPETSAVVFQEPRLLPWLNVAENLALALPSQSKKKKKAAIADALAQVRLAEACNLMPRELSGGMAQRAGIARALLQNASLLLMDEPFAALDAITRTDLQRMLRALIIRNNAACLFVTHDINETLTISDQILLLKERRIHLAATLEIKENPQELRAAIMRLLHPARNDQDVL